MMIADNTGKEITLRGILLCGTMDAPAKCLLQNFVQFNGFSGCPCCLETGTSVKTSEKGHTLTYPFNREILLKGYCDERTHANTLQHAYNAHKSRLEGNYAPVNGVKGYSWLMFVPGFDIIKGIAIDYMHCVLLGIMKMLMTLWFDKAHASEPWNISKKVELVDKRLLSVSPPNCISRSPRSIVKDLSHWKASEFRSFLFFYGIPCLWNILPEEYLQHFILFIEAISLLDQRSISPQALVKAGSLLPHFCLRVEALYGKRYETFNLHCLLHLPECVKNISPLWSCSCFWFEDFNEDLRKMFHGTQKIELQIAFSVCVQQKIPELIPFLPTGSTSKEFFEHMTGSSSSLKCQREKISKRSYALGALSPAHLSKPITDAIENILGANITQAFSFKRIQIERYVIHSKSYVNVSHRNSCTIYVDNVGLVEVRVFVKVFVRCPNPLKCTKKCCCKLPHYFGISDCIFETVANIAISTERFTYCNPQHVLPVRRKQHSTTFPITAVNELCVLVDCGHKDCMFICKLPNQWEKD